MAMTPDFLDTLIDQTLNFDHEGDEFDCRLVEVTRLKAHQDQASEPFSLIFESSEATVRPQGTYRVVHDALGEQLWFIVPIGTSETGVRYEAIFN